MYLRNCWYMAGWSSDFATDTIVPVTILDEPIAFYRKSNGEPAALEDRCCHRLVPLSVGQREGDDLRCMYHGLKFAPDGRCNEIPGQSHISPAVCVRSYPVAERHACVWVWMGKPELADEALIPPIIGPDNADWALHYATFDFDANAGLICDNLLDLSHAPYVHGQTFGAGNEDVARTMKEGEASTKVSRLERGVHLERWHLGRPSNPYINTGATDDFIVNDFLAPGVFMLLTRSYTPGVQARGNGDAQPSEDPVLMRYTCQMITPVTDQKSKFFFAFGPWAKIRAQSRQFFDVAHAAFKEDQAIIEAQQQMMNRSPGHMVMSLSMDAPLVRYQGVLRQLLKEDREKLEAA